MGESPGWREPLESARPGARVREWEELAGKARGELASAERVARLKAQAARRGPAKAWEEWEEWEEWEVGLEVEELEVEPAVLEFLGIREPGFHEQADGGERHPGL